MKDEDKKKTPKKCDHIDLLHDGVNRITVNVKTEEKNKIKLHYLCSWWDILEETKLQKTFSADTIKEVESFLHSPREWQNERL